MVQPIRVPSLLLLALAAMGQGGCSKAPASVAGCTIDSDCAPSGWCQAGTCQAPYLLSLQTDLLPKTDGRLYTDGKVNVTVAVTGGTPPAIVTILVDGRRKATVAPGQIYGWDTAGLTDGSYTLSATVSAGTRTYQSDDVDVWVDRTVPAKPSIDKPPERTKVTQLRLTGEADEKTTLTIWDGASQLTSMVVPNGGVWQATVDLPDERTYLLTATATDLLGHVSPASEARTVVVDRQAPTVVERVPAPDAVNVWTRDPITITFSEPIDPATVNAANVQLSGGSSGVLSATAALSADGRVLTIVPSALPAVPDRLTATVRAGLADVAGNTLAGPAIWSWDVPEWHLPVPRTTIGTDSSLFTTVAVAPDSSLWQAWQMSYAPGSSPNVSHSAAGAWSGLGWLPVSGVYRVFGCALAVDSTGRPIVAHAESQTPGDFMLRVSRYDQGAWTQLGDALDTIAFSWRAKLVVDAQDRPIVAWMKGGSVFVKRWTGSDWEALGGSLGSDVTAFDIALGPGDGLSCACQGSGGRISLFRNGGWGWSAAGPNSASAAATELALALDESGAEVVLLSEAGLVRAIRWGGSFTGFAALGGALADSGGSHVNLALRQRGAPGKRLVAAFVGAGPRVMAWSGSDWTTIGSSIATPTASMYQPAGTTLAVNADGVLAYAWGVLAGPWTTQLTFVRYNQ